MSKIEQKPIEAVIPYELNNKIHAQAEIDRVANSIAEFGWTYPILIDEQNIILAGHKRLLAAKKLGLKDVPVIIKDGLTAAQKKAYRIIDNKSSQESPWDLPNIELELSSLDEAGFNLEPFGLCELRPEIFDVEAIDAPSLSSEEKRPFRAVTFTLHDDQFEEVARALSKAILCGAGSSDLNENKNGNALSFICARFNNG